MAHIGEEIGLGLAGLGKLFAGGLKGFDLLGDLGHGRPHDSQARQEQKTYVEGDRYELDRFQQGDALLCFGLECRDGRVQVSQDPSIQQRLHEDGDFALAQFIIRRRVNGHNLTRRFDKVAGLRIETVFGSQEVSRQSFRFSGRDQAHGVVTVDQRDMRAFELFHRFTKGLPHPDTGFLGGVGQLPGDRGQPLGQHALAAGGINLGRRDCLLLGDFLKRNIGNDQRQTQQNQDGHITARQARGHFLRRQWLPGYFRSVGHCRT